MAAVLVHQGIEECLEAPGFDPWTSGGADERGEFIHPEGLERAGVEGDARFQLGQGAFHVGPLGILREDGAEANLERGASGPPLLVTLPLPHARVGLPQDGQIASRATSSRNHRCFL